MRSGSRGSDQNQYLLRSRLTMVIGGAGFSYDKWWEGLGGKVWRVNVDSKDDSRFTINLNREALRTIKFTMTIKK